MKGAVDLIGSLWRRVTSGEPERATGRYLIALLFGFAATFVLAVVIVGVLGGGRGLQIAVAGLMLLIVLTISVWNRKIGIAEGLGVGVALIAFAAALVSGLTSVGSIESAPDFGCINSDGKNTATISARSASIFSVADHTSTPSKLLLEGCVVEYDDYCIGSVQDDALYPDVPDSRWLKLSDDELIAAADMVGVVPKDQDPEACPGGKARPNRLSFERAVFSTNDWIEVEATAPRAAFIGFAFEEDGKWRRIGWDRTPDKRSPEIFLAPSEAEPGDVVFAVPCMAFERPTGPMETLRMARTGKLTAEPPPPKALQPAHEDPAEAACDAGVPEE